MTLLQKILDYGKNIFQKPKVIFQIEEGNWSIKWDGKYITESLNSIHKDKFAITSTKSISKVRNSIIHFGSKYLYIQNYQKIHSSNKVVFTWFHSSLADREKYSNLLRTTTASFIHTSCDITIRELLEIGVDSKKIVKIPIGIDLSLFKPFKLKDKTFLKKKLGIPVDKIVIGSFQKDGNGWAEGNDPKLIKGPDVFCEVIEKLARSHPIFILLTGPARGYVKKRLQKANIPFKHIFLDDYLEIVPYYQVLDLYLITSRAEGGPKAVLETMATGIPIIATKVGICPEIIKNGQNGFLCEIESVESLVENCNIILSDKSLQRKFVENGKQTVLAYDYKIIAADYYQKLYAPLLPTK